MKKNFYRAFEDRYRGSRDLIVGRLQFYRPFIEPLLAEFGRVPAIDLGCGRGEWLEVILSAGFDARGIDLDEGMLQSCVNLGLPAEKGEAIAHLRALPSKSQAIVSAFHVVEHIPFDALEELVSEAKRVLLPGGLLILETPNPENIMVATCGFYNDPTHQRPIPPNLLSFVAEYAGFERVKVIRLQESKELAAKPDLLLEDVLGGVSPDYSVVAQKKGKKSTMSALSSAFSQDYGLTLSGLSASYDAHMKGKAGEERLKLMQERFEAEKATLASRLSTLTVERDSLATEREALATRLSTIEAERSSLQLELHKIHQANHQHFQLAESLKQELVAKEQTWSEERSTLDARLSTISSEHSSLIAERDALATERNTLLAERSTLDSRLSALLAERDTLAASHSLLATEREALSARLSSLVSEHEALSSELNNVHQANHGHWQLAESLKQELAAKEQAWSEECSTLDSRVSTLVAERDALLASTCWRITSPIRWARGGVRMPWPADRALLKHATLFIRKIPRLKAFALKILFRYPGLHAQVLPIVTELKLAEAPADSLFMTPNPDAVSADEDAKPSDPPDLRGLTVEAQKVYHQIVASIEQLRRKDP